MKFKGTSLSKDPSKYYSIDDIAEIILTDKNSVKQAMESRSKWTDEYLILLDNPIKVDGEPHYNMYIMAMLDEIINIPDMSQYKKNYQDRISNKIYDII